MHRYTSAHLLISEFFSSSSCFRSVLRLTVTLLVMLRARSANLRVLQVSSKARMEGEMVAMIMVLQLPPRESCRRWVSLESLHTQGSEGDAACWGA